MNSDSSEGPARVRERLATLKLQGGLRRRFDFSLGNFLAGLSLGVMVTFALLSYHYRTANDELTPGGALSAVCYSCFWQGYDSTLRAEVINYYRQYNSDDPIVSANVGYILWRAAGNRNCDVRDRYREAIHDADVFRRVAALAALGFSAPECGESGRQALTAAAKAAREANLKVEADLLAQIGRNQFRPKFGTTEIQANLTVPAGARTMILGRSAILVEPNTIVGAQVDRVARDWISYQMRWDLSGRPLPPASLLPYHEGAFAAQVAKATPVSIYPLAGSIVARNGDRWLAPDEDGVFRFEVFPDKLQYPTSHAGSDAAWILDTHGISALVPQALERGVQLLIGCGDAPGKAQAAFYLAQRGMNVVFPGDRYEDMLLGYQAKGTLMGGAPVRQVNGKAVVGDQPVGFELVEPIVVQDTKRPFPIQYYDAPARYFRRLRDFVKLNVEYVDVNGPNELTSVLQKARQAGSTAVAVRVATKSEDEVLRSWLGASAHNRAILFHSALYPYAKPLFADFPRQVTFGDLRPVFE